MSYFLAVDIGGTKLAAGLVEESGFVKRAKQTPTPTTLDPEKIFLDLIELIEQVLNGSKISPISCGVGCGGPMDLTSELVSPLNIPGWRNFPLRYRLEQVLGMRVFVDNDAKAIALAEGWKGAAQKEKNYIGMVVSTGIGGGIILNGHLLDGNAGNAGHIGHVIVEPNGRMCRCGARGCLEAEASGTSISAIIGKPTKYADLKMIQRSGMLVGRAVASVMNLLDLKLAVVGGSVALGFGEPFFESAQEEINRSACLDYSLNSIIVPPILKDQAPLIGAAAIARRFNSN